MNSKLQRRQVLKLTKSLNKSMVVCDMPATIVSIYQKQNNNLVIVKKIKHGNINNSCDKCDLRARNGCKLKGRN